MMSQPHNFTVLETMECAYVADKMGHWDCWTAMHFTYFLLSWVTSRGFLYRYTILYNISRKDDRSMMIGKDLEGSCHCVIEVLSRRLHRVSEDKRGSPQSQ
jgi:hypothetical protein